MLKNSPQLVTLSQNHMATTFDLTLSVEEALVKKAERVLTECHALLENYEKALSEFLPLSPVYQWNHAHSDQKPSLNGKALELLQISEMLSDLTHDAFSPFAKGHTLSFGAIGKGFALDAVRGLLESYDFHNYLLNAGGSSLLLAGFASLRSPWTIGWSVDGKSVSIPLTHRSGFPIALGISGTSEKGFHLLNPKTQEPITHCRSAFVSHTSATYADALSTALFVAGWDEALKNFNQFAEKPALAFLDLNNTYSWNGTFEKQWGPLPC